MTKPDTASCTAGAFLDSKPTSPKLTLSDGAFSKSCQFRLGVRGFAPGAPPAKCACSQIIHGNDATHALTCRYVPSSYQHYQPVIVTEAIWNVTCRAGLTSTCEPQYRVLDPTISQAG